MTITRRTVSTATVAVLIATAAVSGAAPANAADCLAATRPVDTKTNAQALLLSPKGHVLASESDPGATTSLWLHGPNGSAVRVAAVNSASPDGPRDVNAKGYVIGTDRHLGTIAPFTPWVFGLGDYWNIPLPADATDDYLAIALNRSGVVVGVHTNARRATPAQTGYFSRPQLWPTLGTPPVTLPLPHSGYYVVGGIDRPMIDIRADGQISAVVHDHASTRYLARWADASSQPKLVQLPDGFEPLDVAGRWVIGFSALTPSAGRVVIWSPTSATQLTQSLGRFIDLGVTVNGTYAATVSVEQNGASMRSSLIGRGTGAPRTVADAGLQSAVEPTQYGQLLLTSGTDIAVMTCGLQLAVSTDVTASAWP